VRTEEHLYSGISQLIKTKQQKITHISAEGLFLSVIINMLAGFEVGLTLRWIAAWT